MASKTKKPDENPLFSQLRELLLQAEVENAELAEALKEHSNTNQYLQNKESEDLISANAEINRLETELNCQCSIVGLSEIYYKQPDNLLDETIMQAFGVLLAKNSNNAVLDLLQAVAGKKNLNEITDTIKAFY